MLTRIQVMRSAGDTEGRDIYINPAHVLLVEPATSRALSSAKFPVCEITTVEGSLLWARGELSNIALILSGE